MRTSINKGEGSNILIINKVERSNILINFGGFGEPSINEINIHTYTPSCLKHTYMLRSLRFKTYIHVEGLELKQTYMHTYIRVWSLAGLLEVPSLTIKETKLLG